MLKKNLYAIKANRNRNVARIFKEKQFTPFLSFILSGKKLSSSSFIQKHGF